MFLRAADLGPDRSRRCVRRRGVVCAVMSSTKGDAQHVSDNDVKPQKSSYFFTLRERVVVVI